MRVLKLQMRACMHEFSEAFTEWLIILGTKCELKPYYYSIQRHARLVKIFFLVW